MITTITKRDGRTVHFDINKIASAIEVRSDEVRENEHESLLAAIEAGDGALARREMERHLEHVGENLQAYFAGRK